MVIGTWCSCTNHSNCYTPFDINMGGAMHIHATPPATLLSLWLSSRSTSKVVKLVKQCRSLLKE